MGERKKIPMWTRWPSPSVPQPWRLLLWHRLPLPFTLYPKSTSQTTHVLSPFWVFGHITLSPGMPFTPACVPHHPPFTPAHSHLCSFLSTLQIPTPLLAPLGRSNCTFSFIPTAPWLVCFIECLSNFQVHVNTGGSY